MTVPIEYDLYAADGPVAGLARCFWTDDGSKTDRYSLEVGIVWGMLLAAAAPEFALTLLSRGHTGPDLRVRLEELREWVERYPISAEQAAQS